MYSIHLKQICHRFDFNHQTLTLFKQLDLVVEQGKTLAITGPSGSGKTSLLLLMAGMEQPVSGEVLLQRNNKNCHETLLKTISGFVFQQFHLLSELSALDNVALPLRLLGDNEASEKASHWLEQVGLADRASHSPFQLSGGEQQRVALARAFARDCAFIFADEPTGNLDPHTAERISDLLFTLAEKNNTGLILVTHNGRLATRADRHFHLTNGVLCCHDHPSLDVSKAQNSNSQNISLPQGEIHANAE